MKKNASKKEGAKSKKTAKGHKLAPKIPHGTVLTDNASKKWILGLPIGCGGFGCLYLTKALENSVEHVLKLEPLENGPLFCEINFYIRSAKSDMILEWMEKNCISKLGVPNFVGSGQLDYSGGRYRFLVMPKFGSDLQKIFESNGKLFDPHIVFLLGYKIINSLQYIHEKGFAHADIKAANLMIGLKDPDNVYLIDYGLAFRYLVDGRREVYKLDPKWAHNGTVEFTSRDAHAGAKPAPRGDLEILGYCMWQWLTGSLPWETNLNDVQFVTNQKNRYMSDIKKLISPLIANKIASNELCNFLSEIYSLDYSDIPNYEVYRKIFERAIKSLGHKLSETIRFEKTSKITPTRKRKSDEDSSSITTPFDEANDNTPSHKKRGVNANNNNKYLISPSKEMTSQSLHKKILDKNHLASTTFLKSPTEKKGLRNINVSPSLDLNSINVNNNESKSNVIPLSPTNAISPKKKTAIVPARKISNKPKRTVKENPPFSGENPRRIQKIADKTTKVANRILSTGTQTSPGLAGLPRSREKKS